MLNPPNEDCFTGSVGFAAPMLNPPNEDYYAG